MTLWNLGRETDWRQACKDSKIIQYKNGKYLIEIGLCENNMLYYVVHYWKGSQTLHTSPALLRQEMWPNAKSLEGFRYERDGFMQVKVLKDAGRSRWIWVDASKLQEIIDLEEPEPP